MPRFEPELLGRTRESVHLEALRYGPPCPCVGGEYLAGRWGDSQRRWGNRVHDPMLWAGGYFSNVHANCFIWGESVEAADRHLGGRVRKVITPDVGMGPDFLQGCAVARQPPSFKNVCDALKNIPVVMVVPRTADT